MYKIKLATLKEIYSARDRWNELVFSMEFPNIFLTWEWITTWLEHFGDAYRLLIFFFYKGEDLQAILPLAQTKVKLNGAFCELETITICGGIELYPDHLDIIHGRDVDVESILDSFFEFLSRNINQWDLLYFPFLAKHGALSSYLLSRDLNLNFTLIKTNAPFIKNEEGFEILLQNFKGKKRYNLNREKKRLFKIHDVKLNKVDSIKELDSALENLFHLHNNRTKNKGIVSTFSSPKIYSFHRDLMFKIYDKGWLSIYFLCSDNNPIAAAYGFVFGKRYSYYQSGMDMKWEKFSPGKILIFEIIREEFQKNGVLEFDFLAGDENYKKFWTNHTRELFTITIYNKNISAFFEYFFVNCKFFIKRVFLKRAFNSVFLSLSS